MAFSVAEGADRTMEILNRARASATAQATTFGVSAWGTARGLLNPKYYPINGVYEMGPKFAMAGAIGGLTASAIGLGLRGVFGGDRVQEDGPVKGIAKGALIGAGFGAGALGLGMANRMFGANANQFKNAKGVIGSTIGMMGRTLGSKPGTALLAGGLALGAGATLLKSIISTNFTRPTE